MDKTVAKSRLRRFLVWVGFASLLISALPWLGLSGYCFALPRCWILLPRLNVITVDDRPLYELLSIPLQLIAPLKMREFICFGGRDTHVVTPFAIFAFYFIVGIPLACVGGIPRVSVRGLLGAIGVLCVVLSCLMAISRANDNANTAEMNDYREKMRQDVFSRRSPLYSHFREYFTEAELRELDRTHHGP